MSSTNKKYFALYLYADVTKNLIADMANYEGQLFPLSFHPSDISVGIEVPTTIKMVADAVDFFIGIDSTGALYKIAKSDLLAGLSSGGGSTSKLIQLLDSKTSGTVGGTPTVGSWTQRTINTLQVDDLGTTNLAGNIFTIDAGTYDINVVTVYYKADFVKTRLFNVSDNIVVNNVFSVNGYNGAEATSFSILAGRLTLTARKSLSVEYRVSRNSGSTGLGEPCSFGVNEIFLLANILKIA